MISLPVLLSWRRNLLLPVVAAIVLASTEAFGPLHAVPGRSARSLPFLSSRQSSLCLKGSLFDFDPSFDDDEADDDDEEDDEEDEDEEAHIDPDSLGDWRTFRRNLASNPERQQETPPEQPQRSVSRENEQLLKSQSEELALEYTAGVWAHETSTPEVGGLVVRLPLEAEIHRNYKHSMIGRKLRKTNKDLETAKTFVWYKKAQRFLDEGMLQIADEAGDDGQIDPSGLNDERAELLQLYLDNQESWQEVCLVMERSEEGKATLLVLNRPMAFKLSENIGKMVLFGTYLTEFGETPKVEPKADSLIRFMLAFGRECAVYTGGPDGQDEPAEIIHGIAGLAGAVEISSGSRIYRGGMEAAIDGVLRGLYSPLDFRFFVGCHVFEESTLDVSVVLGKYQPIACARTLALKQCIALPKPLWHEVLELCGGEMEEISRLEFLKRGDIRFEIADDDDDEFGDDDALPDELDELLLDDEDDEYDDN